MTKRPLCIAALVWAAVLWLLGTAGIPFLGFSPPRLPEKTEGSQVLVSGIVYRADSYTQSNYLYLKKTSLILNSEKYPIDNVKVKIRTENGKLLAEPGSKVLIKGALEEIPLPANPGQFHERNYNYARKVKWYLEGSELRVQEEKAEIFLFWQNWLKRKLEEGISRSIREEVRGIFLAMITGEKGELSQEQKSLFASIGGSHVLAISGLHLSVLGWGFYKVLRRLQIPVKVAGLASSGWIFFYGIMTGSSASAMRAAVMFGAAMGAVILGRTYDFLSSVALASILLLAESPLYLYDSSFLLSFGAVAGLGVIEPLLFSKTREKKERNGKDKVIKALGKGIRSGISVWLATLPVVMYFFYEISVWGILVNLAVLPTVNVVLISGVLGCVLGMLPGGWILIGKAAAMPGTLLVLGYLKAGELVRRIPVYMWITGRPELWKCGVYYLLLLAALLLKQGHEKTERRKIWKQRFRKWIRAWICPLFLILGVLVLSVRIPGYALRIVFLDVGQGDCACILTREGSCYLIDGGSSSLFSVGRYRILPFLKSQGVRKVDGIFVSHMDEDHVNGIREFLEMVQTGETAVKIGYLFLSECRETQDEIKNLEQVAQRVGCRTVYIRAGTEIKEKNLIFRCFSPKNNSMGSNEGSQVLGVSMGDFDALFTGDVEGEGEKHVQQALEVQKKSWEILKIAHHGSRNSTSRDFLEMLCPDIGIISCGKDNRYGHPHGELLERLKYKKIPTVQTWQTGAVTADWDGKSTKVSFQYKQIMLE